MCKITDDLSDLCQTCYDGGACWSAIYRLDPPPPSFPVEVMEDLEHEPDEWDARFLEPAYLPYWTLSGNFQQDGYVRARALCTHT